MSSIEYNKRISSNRTSIPQINLNNTGLNSYNPTIRTSSVSRVSTSTSGLNLDLFLTDNIDEQSTEGKIEDSRKYTSYQSGWDKIGEVIASAGATVAVATTSVLSGVLDIAEGLADGTIWLASKAVGIFSSEAETSMKEFIARDLVSEANQAFYENTDLGRSINNASTLKYDSETAQTIRSVTTTVTEIAAATALTICTGGAAAPFVVGTMVGLGKAAESTYQTKGTDTTFMQELGIAGSGALTGLSWMANGRLGQGFVNIAKDSAALGVKNVVSGIMKEMTTSTFWKESLKRGLSIKDATGKININAVMNYLTSAFSTAGTLTPYITGEEQFDKTAAVKILSTYVTYLGLNVVEDIFRDYIGDYTISDEKATELASRIINNEVDMRAIQNSGLSQNSIARISEEVIKRDIATSRIAPNTTEKLLLDIMYRHDSKYGTGSANNSLLEFCNPNSTNYHNYNLISSNNGGRALLRQLSPEEIEHAMNNLTYNYDRIGDFSGHFIKHGSPADHNYGADQGGIEALCRYELNGQNYTYRQATQIYNDALNNGQPLPHFKKIATQEYADLKYKLISQGFSDRDASIIMSTVNDAGACSYATIVNEIFASYLGNPTKFQQDFGYPMYINGKNGDYVLNSNELLLDLYVHANKVTNGGTFINPDNTLNTRYLSNKRDVFGRNLLDAENQQYMSYYSSGKNTRMISSFLGSKGVTYQSTWIMKNTPNHRLKDKYFKSVVSSVQQELSLGHCPSIDIYSGGKPINMISTNKMLYSSTSTLTWSEGGGHSMFITGIGSDCFYVSSWGQEYSIPFQDLQNGGMFNIFSAIIK